MISQMDYFIPNELEMHLITAHGIPATALSDARDWARRNDYDYDEYLRRNIRVLAALWCDSEFEIGDCGWDDDLRYLEAEDDEDDGDADPF